MSWCDPRSIDVQSNNKLTSVSLQWLGCSVMIQAFVSGTDLVEVDLGSIGGGPAVVTGSIYITGDTPTMTFIKRIAGLSRLVKSTSLYILEFIDTAIEQIPHARVAAVAWRSDH